MWGENTWNCSMENIVNIVVVNSMVKYELLSLRLM